MALQVKSVVRALAAAGGVAALLAATGCSTPVALLKQTQSGYAEGVFSNRPVDSVKSALIDSCVSRGYGIQDASPNQIICTQNLKEGEQILAQFMMGNAYSTPPQKKARFTIYQVGQNTKVVASLWVETQMAFGQVKQVELNAPAQVNSLQSMLFSLGAK